MADNYQIKDAGGQNVTFAAKEISGPIKVPRSIPSKEDGTALIGSIAAASSLSTALSTEDVARIGAVTETAPGTDTASSGLNGRLQRIAQRLTSLIALFPSSLGGKTAANSLAVTTATDDPTIALRGAVNETAPATDTASSGHNGRLQRIAQRLTSLIALLPASLGGKTAANSLSVTTATDDPLITLTGAVNETAPGTDTASSGINGRLQRIAQRLASLIALLPSSLGSKAAAASLAVTSSTENVAQIGATNESAAGSDTATSGLNGLLKRIAQNITTLTTAFNGAVVASSTPYSLLSGASTNATVVKASAGTVYHIDVGSTDETPVYLKLYNKATTPSEADTPIARLTIPGSADGMGSGRVLPLPNGLVFSTGIAFRLTTGAPNNNTDAVAANEVTVNIGYV